MGRLVGEGVREVVRVGDTVVVGEVVREGVGVDTPVFVGVGLFVKLLTQEGVLDSVTGVPVGEAERGVEEKDTSVVGEEVMEEVPVLEGVQEGVGV